MSQYAAPPVPMDALGSLICATTMLPVRRNHTSPVPLADLMRTAWDTECYRHPMTCVSTTSDGLDEVHDTVPVIVLTDSRHTPLGPGNVALDVPAGTMGLDRSPLPTDG